MPTDLNIPRMTAMELETKEQIIEQGKQAFVEVGTALAEIRDRHGYRLLGYETFEEYCRVRWGWSRQSAAYYMDAASVVRLLPAEMSSQLDITAAAELSRLARPSENGDKRRKHIDAEAVRAVAGNVDFGKVTVKQVAAQVDEVIREWKHDELVKRGKQFEEQPKQRVGQVTVHCADARQLDDFVEAESVQLIITSPPYNVGIDYSRHNDSMLDLEYEELLAWVFTKCLGALCDGGRIAVIVPFGVGRSPYVPMSSEVSNLLRAVGFTLRGVIVWDKGVSGGRTAWGSFRLPTNPSLRDTTEAVIVAHKGDNRLEVPENVLQNDEKGKFSPFLQDPQEFLDLTNDHWAIAPESAERIGHPTPFPVGLVKRLIRLYAYPGAHVLDPFAGSGTVGVAAIELGCQATLVEIDPAYCELARERSASAFQANKTP